MNAFLLPAAVLVAETTTVTTQSAASSRPLLGLLLVAALVALFGLGLRLKRRLDDRRIAGPLEAAPPVPPKPAAPSPGGDGIPPEVLAVIAAAVDTVLHGRGRVLAVHEQGPSDHRGPDPRLLAWSMEGRRQIFSSHQPR